MVQQDSLPNPSATRPHGTTKSAADSLPVPIMEEFLYPDFVFQNTDGIWVDPAVMDGPSEMQRFVDRVFAAEAYFVGLDYDAFWRLLYLRPEKTPVAGTAALRIADRIANFDPVRLALYKSAKYLDQSARIEYIFAPVWLEQTIETPIYGEGDEDGSPVLTGHSKLVRRVPTKLDADEFVAAMWLKGIRSGIDIDAVRAAVASGRDERIDIARRLDPTAGADATVQEKSSAMHRDDSPSILPNGKVDLSHFKNHFPQVSAGTRLLQKHSRRLGVYGVDTDGTILEADVPRDFDLADMAGLGTRIERTAKGEFIVAARDGYLTVDKKSHQISIAEKIVNRDGVSLRTTGNLLLVGDYYDEHGEVQEHRRVEGKHMNFHADVFGSIVSSGGGVHLHSNLAGGSIKNESGVVKIDGRVTAAVVEVRGGEIEARYAESATLVAAKVRLGRAVSCDIVAEEVEIGDSIGCTIAARRIKINSAGAQRSAETLITVCTPDFTVLDKRRAESLKEVNKLQSRITAKQALLEARMTTDEIRKYYSADRRIQSGALKLTESQETQWKLATQRMAGPMFEIQALQQELNTLNLALEAQNELLSVVDAQRAQAGANIGCEVKRIAGELTVELISINPDDPVFSGIETTKLRRKLRDARKISQRLFRADSGTFSWNWKPAGGK